MTVQTKLNNANPNDIPAELQRISFGDLVAGLIPVVRARTGLTSSATQVHDKGAIILSVEATVGTSLAIVTGSVGAGQVSVNYDANGVATMVHNGAVTGYTVTELVLPIGLGTTLASEP